LVVDDHTSEVLRLRSEIERERRALRREASAPPVGSVAMLLLLAFSLAAGSAVALWGFIAGPRSPILSIALVLGAAWSAGCAYLILREVRRFKKTHPA
jgi:hypothetical protein